MLSIRNSSSKDCAILHNLILHGSGHLYDRISLNAKKSVLTVSGFTALNTKMIYVHVTRIVAQVTDCILSTLQVNNPVNPTEHANVNVLYGLVRALSPTGF